MAAADTNILVRLLVADHPAQLRAVQRCVAKSGPLYVSQVALVETIWVLAYTYRLARRDLGAVVGQILAGADFVLEQPRRGSYSTGQLPIFEGRLRRLCPPGECPGCGDAPARDVRPAAGQSVRGAAYHLIADSRATRAAPPGRSSGLDRPQAHRGEPGHLELHQLARRERLGTGGSAGQHQAGGG